jgi:uncharacterized protein
VKIRVNDITEKEKVLEASDPISAYPTLLQVQDADECEFLSPIAISLSLVKEFDHIRLHGEVSTSVRLSCSRCLSEFDSRISSGFTIFYTRSDSGHTEEEVELGEEDLLSVTYSGDEIDFTNEIAEQVLLGIPYKPLCFEDCRGLCSSCGNDLNNSNCNCSEQGSSFAFSPLKGLKVNN